VKRATTTNALRTSLRQFFAYSHAAGWIASNPARLIRRARCAPPPPKGMSDNDARRFLDALAEATTPTEQRDRVLFTVMLQAGLRVGSALALDAEDVDLERAELRIHTSKGDRPDVVLLRRELVDLLAGYIDGRTGALFTTDGGTRLSLRQAQRRFAIWCDRAGISGYSCHSLRHTFATRLYRATGDVYLVQQALRHRSIVSTTVYARIDRGRLRAAIEA